MALHYQPGVCNISTSEIQKRQRYGYINTLITITVLAFAWYFQPPQWLQALVFFPIYGAIISFWQARTKFCAGFALADMYQDAKTGEIKRVEDKTEQRVNQARAWRMAAGSAVMSGFMTALALAGLLLLQ